MTDQDFDAFARRAGELDADIAAEQGQEQQPDAGGPGAPQPDAAPEVDPLDANQRALELILTGLRLALDQVSARTAALWTDDKLQQISQAGARVMVKYGINLGDAGKWKEEITLLWTLGPLVLATVKTLREELQAERAAAAKEVKPAAEQTSGSGGDQGSQA